MANRADTLAEAFDRIDDFYAVHRSRPIGEMADSVDCFLESVDLDDDARAVLRERLPQLPEIGDRTGQVILGIVIGLMAAQLAAEAGEEAALSG